MGRGRAARPDPSAGPTRPRALLRRLPRSPLQDSGGRGRSARPGCSQFQTTIPSGEWGKTGTTGFVWAHYGGTSPTRWASFANETHRGWKGSSKTARPTPVCQTDATETAKISFSRESILPPACYVPLTGFTTDDVARPGCARPSGSMMRPERAREGGQKREVIERRREKDLCERGDRTALARPPFIKTASDAGKVAASSPWQKGLHRENLDSHHISPQKHPDSMELPGGRNMATVPVFS
jgi:hypothetical protein